MMNGSENRSFRALVVDDDELSRDVASSILKRLGASEVIEAASGSAAIAWADTDHGVLDLVLCDLRMPEVDGLETLDELARRTYPRLFVLASGADRRIVRAAVGSISRVDPGRLRVIGKPMTIEKLDAVVQALADRMTAPGPELDLLHKTPPDCSTDMVRSLAQGDFVPFYAPKLHVASQRVDSVEAVWRWQHPRYGVLAPDAFVSVAQSVGLIEELFLSIFRRAVVDAVASRQRGQDLALALNVPPAVLASREAPQLLAEIAALHGLPTQQITLEVAESAWLEERDHAREVLTRLRLRGFGLAIDDFGAGFSTIKQLLDAPFNEMKLDPSLLHLAADDRETAIALSSYLTVARELDMTIVAQGIDRPAQLEHAARLGCDRIQGRCVGAPVTAAAVEDWALHAP